MVSYTNNEDPVRPVLLGNLIIDIYDRQHILRWSLPLQAGNKGPDHLFRTTIVSYSLLYFCVHSPFWKMIYSRSEQIMSFVVDPFLEGIYKQMFSRTKTDQFALMYKALWSLRW